MGFTPAEIRKMSVWETRVIFEADSEAKGGGDGGTLSDGEKDEIWEWMKSKEA